MEIGVWTSILYNGKTAGSRWAIHTTTDTEGSVKKKHPTPFLIQAFQG